MQIIQKSNVNLTIYSFSPHNILYQINVCSITSMKSLCCYTKCVFSVEASAVIIQGCHSVFYKQILKNKDGQMNLNVRHEITECSISFSWLHSISTQANSLTRFLYAPDHEMYFCVLGFNVRNLKKHCVHIRISY